MLCAQLMSRSVVQVMELLAEHLGQWATSVAFPELAHLPLVQLRRFAKTVAVERFKAQVRPWHCPQK